MRASGYVGLTGAETTPEALLALCSVLRVLLNAWLLHHALSLLGSPPPPSPPRHWPAARGQTRCASPLANAEHHDPSCVGKARETPGVEHATWYSVEACDALPVHALSCLLSRRDGTRPLPEALVDPRVHRR